jgi:spermidine synthase
MAGLVAAILVTGLSGIVAEVVLLRELLVVFNGNELTIGIILANWLMMEAVGAIAGGRLGKGRGMDTALYVVLQLAFAVCLPVAVFGVRSLRSTLGLAGESLGLGPVFFSSLFLAMPLGIAHGALFAAAVRIYAHTVASEGRGTHGSDSAAIGKVYVLETLGTVAGGVLLSFLLLSMLDSLTIAVLVSLVICLACVALVHHLRGAVVERAVSTAMALLFVMLILSGGLAWLRRISMDLRWPDLDVVLHLDSIYGNIAVAGTGEQYTFFENGSPIVTTPNPDIELIEEFAHMALLSHPDPRRALVISGGVGGLLTEVLKHPVEAVHYCELDPTIIEAVRLCPTPLTEAELASERVKILNTDGRLAVRRAGQPYDVILLGLSLPTDLQGGRLFTTGFFRMAAEKLTPRGVLALHLPGSLTYLEENLAKANLSVLRALKQVFPAVRVFPGYTNLYLASGDPELLDLDAAEMAQRMELRKLSVRYLIPAQIRYRMEPRWSDQFFSALERVEARPATDFHPVTVFYGLSHWNALYSPGLRHLVSWLAQLKWWSLAAAAVVALGCFLVMRALWPALSAQTSLVAAVLWTGFGAMILQLVLIMSYQVVYGYVYHQVALLITAFMLGTALGSALIVKLLRSIRDRLRWLLALEASIAAFAILVPAAILLLKPAADAGSAYGVLQLAYLMLSASSGFLIGVEFPLCNAVYLSRSADVGATAGLLYGSDLLGGWLGGILGAVLLVPVLGLWGTCAVVMACKGMSGLMVALSARSL